MPDIIPQQTELKPEQELAQLGGAFATGESFKLAQRIAQALASSSLVPEAYIGNIPNVLIAIEVANRIGSSVMAVMQHLYIVHGKPAFDSTFLIATVNSSTRFTPLRYRFEGEPGTDAWGCRTVAIDRETQHECVGPLVTLAMAKAEGWYDKKDKYGKVCSKWPTMPELMLSYRAAAFWTRLYAPELSLGMQTVEELRDSMPVKPEAPKPTSLQAVLAAKVEEIKPAQPAEPEPSKQTDKQKPKQNTTAKQSTPVVKSASKANIASEPNQNEPFVGNPSDPTPEELAEMASEGEFVENPEDY